MKNVVSIAEAKSRLSVFIREAEQGRSVVITRHGKRVAALVAAGDLERLERLRSTGSQEGLASVAGGWNGSEDLAVELEGIDRSAPRNADPL